MNFDVTDNEKVIGQGIQTLFQGEDFTRIQGLLMSEDLNQRRAATLRGLKALSSEGYLALGLEENPCMVVLLSAQETLARLSPSLFLAVEVSTRIFGRLVALYGTPGQKAEIMPGLKAGDLIGCVALSEGGMSTENEPFKTLATREGDLYRLSGRKDYVINGPLADWVAAVGLTPWDSGDRLVMFLLPRQTAGLSSGERCPTIGYEGLTLSSVSFANCPVPNASCIGPFEDKTPLTSLRAGEDQILTASSLGLMQRSFDAACHYAKTHVSGARPILAYQEVGFKLAEMLTLVQTARLLAYRAAWMADTGDREAGVLLRCAKVFCSESAEQVASQALQILGGYGYLCGNDAEEGYRNAKFLQIAGTSTEISRMKIADALLH